MTDARLLQRLLRDERGATIVEFAFAFPALVVLIYCVAQLGMVYRAMSGIQHALGEGSRLASIWRVPAVTSDDIRTEMQAAVFGIGPGTFVIPEPRLGATNNGIKFLLLQVNYTQPTSLLLFPGPTVSVMREKRVYLAEQGGAAPCTVSGTATFCLAGS
jgi:Flp pilus assembly pilin Flp